MILKQVIEVMDLLDRPQLKEKEIISFFRNKGFRDEEIFTEKVKGSQGETLFLRLTLSSDVSTSAKPPCLGLIGRLGGIGARPHQTGFVSDADGALTVLAAAAQLAEMRKRGDTLPGKVIIATHLCPNSPIIPHEPVPFMGAPVDMEVMNRYEVSPEMEAILSVDTTKGNRVINQRGIAISPTVKEGYILRVSEDLLDIMERVTGRLPVVFPLTTQDITPYGNDLYHLNSILQPATATTAPVVGLAITSEVPVPGCGTGANQPVDIELAARFVVEVALDFTRGKCRFYDPEEFQKLVELYGPMTHLQTLGRKE
ncbi:DUF1177 domain-containing protein [Candidatus Aminicenantes bacterium AC-334-K16]|jgi:hypothetical protein|nr:DUF1177 domain-containing protein [Candidatus Aminicenantes bacterium AC-334-K16]